MGELRTSYRLVVPQRVERGYRVACLLQAPAGRLSGHSDVHSHPVDWSSRLSPRTMSVECTSEGSSLAPVDRSATPGLATRLGTGQAS